VNQKTAEVVHDGKQNHFPFPFLDLGKEERGKRAGWPWCFPLFLFSATPSLNDCRLKGFMFMAIIMKDNCQIWQEKNALFMPWKMSGYTLVICSKHVKVRLTLSHRNHEKLSQGKVS